MSSRPTVMPREPSSQARRDGDKAMRRRKFELAAACYENAVAEATDDAALHAKLARAYSLGFQYEDAARVNRQIAERFGDRPDILFMLGETSFRTLDFDDSEAWFLDAIDKGLDRVYEVRAYVYVAQIRERLHRLDEAMEAVELALQQWDHHPRASMMHARILKRLGNDGDAEAAYRTICARQDLSADVTADAWYAIAKIEEDKGNFDAAFEAAGQAKSAWHKKAAPVANKAAAMRVRTREMLREVTSETLHQWQTDIALADETPVEGMVWHIGHPRSGTTLLGQVFGGHDDILLADELNVFAKSVFRTIAEREEPDTDGKTPRSIIQALVATEPRQIQTLRETFLKQVQGAVRQPIGNRWLWNKNPDLTGLLPVIARVFPQSKFVFAVRDPRDVVLSCFMQKLPLNPVSVDYFTLQSTAAKYALTMNVWLQLREQLPQQWIEVRYEDVVGDTESEARRVLNFLDLPWQPQVLNFHTRSQSQHVHSPTYDAVTKPIYATSVGRWKNYEKYFEPIIDLLHPYVKAFGYEH